MRLVLPTGDGGAERDYLLDGLIDLAQVTLNEVIELKRCTGKSVNDVYSGMQLLMSMRELPQQAVIVAMSQNLAAMEAWRCLVWLARYRAGDRADDGGSLTVEDAVDFPFAGMDIRADPGDVVDDGDDDDEGPRMPSAGGGPEPGDGDEANNMTDSPGR